MKFILNSLFIMCALGNSDMALAHEHHHHNSNEKDNPPCNHESLNDARDAASHNQ